MFSLAVKSKSNPAPSSIIGATEPLTVILPLVGFNTPAIVLSNVLFPEPLVPTIPNESPRFTSKFIFFKAQNSSYESSLLTFFIKNSFKLSTCSL